MSDFQSRADAVRLRVFKVLGHGGVSKIARDLEESRSYYSAVLNGKDISNPVLDKVEAYLDNFESEQKQAA